MRIARRRLGARIKIVIRSCCVLLMACVLQAQSAAPARTFPGSKADVEKALHSIALYPGGKLPALEGFADAGGHPLDDYKRGYYEYDVVVKSASPTETSVQVSAKITAWYTANTSANSGYRVLKSSGRLESDLLDALNEKLNPVAVSKASQNATTETTLPDSPSASARGGSFFNSPRLTTAPSESRPIPSAATSANLDPAHAKQLARLQAEAKSLDEALRNQARPTNLAVVKRSNTPVVAQPADGSEVLFQAEAEDEFEVLDAAQGWVHIKISSFRAGGSSANTLICRELRPSASPTFQVNGTIQRPSGKPRRRSPSFPASGSRWTASRSKSSGCSPSTRMNLAVSRSGRWRNQYFAEPMPARRPTPTRLPVSW